MSFSSPFNSSFSSSRKQTPTTIQDIKHLKIAEKQIGDLEELCKTLINIQERKQNENQSELCVKDDCYELQKFCFKLEYLFQSCLKEKKGSALSANLSPVVESSFSSREYWSLIQDALKSSKSFQDALKYVKNLNEVKSNLGRARAFIRFCLQYHRLADAVQQITMEPKILTTWYNERSMWFNDELKSRIIQLLYDLNDVDFDLISKNNFELDTTWPTIQLNRNHNTPSGNNTFVRNRTLSFSSLASFNIDNSTNDGVSMLGSTPLEMDDDLMYANIKEAQHLQAQQAVSENMMAQSVYYDVSQYQTQLDNNEKKIDELIKQLSVKDTQLTMVLEELKQKKNGEQKDEPLEASHIEIERLKKQVELLNEQIATKNQQNQELGNCLMRQTQLSDNLSELLKKSESKNTELASNLVKANQKLADVQSDLEKTSDEAKWLRVELDSRKEEIRNLNEENADKSKSIASLKETCERQEQLLNNLKSEFGSVQQERQNAIENKLNEMQETQLSLKLKEEENLQLNELIGKLSKTLNDEREHLSTVKSELDELKLYYVELNEKNNALISQLEADNAEIKKRLVKLIKEKAELWQKADNLEYQNLLKASSMWMDDANVTNCMNCNSHFSLILRKHHCRLCLKIFCYYCCNNWIELNNTKVRCCKSCMEAREKQAEKENELNTTLEEEEEAEEDNADINFEVRAEKLKAASSNQVIVNDVGQQEVQDDQVELSKQSEVETDHDASMSIYDAPHRPIKQQSSPETKDSLKEEKEEEENAITDSSEPRGNSSSGNQKNHQSQSNSKPLESKESTSTYDFLSFLKRMRSSRPLEEQAEGEDVDDLKVDRKSVKKKSKEGKLNTSVSCPVFLAPRADPTEQANNSLQLIQDALVDEMADAAFAIVSQDDLNPNSF